jgi:hypothetical protein
MKSFFSEFELTYRFQSKYRAISYFRAPNIAALIRLPETQPLNILRLLGEALLQIKVAETDEEVLRQMILEFTKGYRPIAVVRTHDQIWYKARPCEGESGYLKLNDMIYIAAGCPNYGRAQLKGAPVIYGGWNGLVALAEVGAQAGHLYQIIAFRPMLGELVPCHVVGEYETFDRTGKSIVRDRKSARRMAIQKRSQPLEFECHAYIDAIISTLFARKITDVREYKITAIYSEIYSGHNGAIIFPSVKRNSDFNIAVHKKVFDFQFEVVLTYLTSICKDGIQSSHPILKQVHEFNKSGDIDWSSIYRRFFTFSMLSGNRENPVLDGWRVQKKDE